MTISLRTALLADRDAVIGLIHQLNVFEEGLTRDRSKDYAAAEAYYDELQRRLAGREGRIVVAETEDGRILAAMGFSIDQDAAYITDDVRLHGTVTDLIVDESARGQGLGQRLLAEAERLTREAGLQRLMIGVLVANDRAAKTYRAFGFEPYVSVLVKGV